MVAIASLRQSNLPATVPVPGHRGGTRRALGSGWPVAWRTRATMTMGRFGSGSQRSKIMVPWPASEKVGECVPNALRCSVGKFWTCQGPHGRQADRPHPHSDRSPAVTSGARAKDVGEPGRLACALKDATSRSSEPCVILAARRVAGTDA